MTRRRSRELHVHDDAFDDDHRAFRAQVAERSRSWSARSTRPRSCSTWCRAPRAPSPRRWSRSARLVSTMTVEMVRGGLDRDRSVLEIEWTEGDETDRVTVRGDAIDTATQPVAGRPRPDREGAWARSATAPS